jgi:uncharacterized protein (TIGR03437 family)
LCRYQWEASAAPIDLGPEVDQLYLVLFGTGFRRRSALSAVSVKIGGVDVTINYAGPQLQLVGLDQINPARPSRASSPSACAVRP